MLCSLVPRPLPGFISQPWRKIRRRPGIKTTSRTNHTYKPSPPFPVHDVVLIPGLLPIFLHSCKIKSGSGLGMRLCVLRVGQSLLWKLYLHSSFLCLPSSSGPTRKNDHMHIQKCPHVLFQQSLFSDRQFTTNH